MNSSQNKFDMDLTVILTLKDRVPFTHRWMAYANESHFPSKILIADGGSDRKVTEILSERNNYPNIDYEYIRYPYDETYSIYHAKKADVLSRVETTFAVFTDNDDFLVYDGLREAVKFLMEHDEYRTCRGETYSFFLEPDINALYGRTLRYLLYPATSLEEDTSRERIAKHFEQYSTTYYDVHRTKDLRLYFNKLHEYDIKDVTLAELLTSFMTVASGKVKKISHPFLLRQYHMNTNCAREDILIDRFDRMLAESWSGDFTAFVKSVSEICAINDNIAIEDAAQHVKRGYRRFIEPVILNSISKNSTQTPSNASGKSRLSGILRGLKLRLTPKRKEVADDPKEYADLNQNPEVARIRSFLMSGSEKG